MVEGGDKYIECSQIAMFSKGSHRFSAKRTNHEHLSQGFKRYDTLPKEQATKYPHFSNIYK